MQTDLNRLVNVRDQVIRAREIVRKLKEDARYCHEIWDPVLRLANHPLQVLSPKLTAQVMAEVDTHLALLDDTVSIAEYISKAMDGMSRDLGSLFMEREILIRNGGDPSVAAHNGQTMDQRILDIEGQVVAKDGDLQSLWQDSRDRLGEIANRAPHRR